MLSLLFMILIVPWLLDNSMFMEFCESGLMQIRLSLVFPIVRNSYPKLGRLKTILMVGFLFDYYIILSANMSGILLNELLVFEICCLLMRSSISRI